jgi:hypothetical protein
LAGSRRRPPPGFAREPRERFRGFRGRDLSGIHLVCLFLDAIYLPTRPSGAKEGVLLAWGSPKRASGCCSMSACGCARRRRTGSSWAARSPAAACARRCSWSPTAPGLVSAIEQLWPEADRQRCTAHRLRDVLAKLPERERVRAAYWRALDEADSQQDGERRLRTLVGKLADQGYAAAAACLGDDLEALTAFSDFPSAHRSKLRSTDENVKQALRQRLWAGFGAMDWSRRALAEADIASCGFGPAGTGARRSFSGTRSLASEPSASGVGALSRRYAPA